MNIVLLTTAIVERGIRKSNDVRAYKQLSRIMEHLGFVTDPNTGFGISVAYLTHVYNQRGSCGELSSFFDGFIRLREPNIRVGFVIDGQDNKPENLFAFYCEGSWKTPTVMRVMAISDFLNATSEVFSLPDPKHANVSVFFEGGNQYLPRPDNSNRNHVSGGEVQSPPAPR